MKVRDIMTVDVVTVRPDTPVAEVARLMLDRELSGLPVMDATERLAGMVTERDLVAKHARVHVPVFIGILGGVLPIEAPGTDEEIRRALAVTAADLMEKDVVTIDADTEVEDAASRMVDDDANPIPVMERGRIVGIVSRADVIRLILIEEGDGTQERSS